MAAIYAGEPALLAGGAFVGREMELEALVRGLGDAVAGRGRLFLLTGEPGIGKTRLAEELAPHAVARGARVYWGRCWESGGAPAFWPWTQVMRVCVADAGQQGLDAAPGIARIVPDMIPWAADGMLPDVLPHEQARFRLFDAVARFLDQQSAGVPLVLVFDDLHTADQASLLLLQFVARAVRRTHVLLIGTYREVEAGRNPTVSALLTDVLREGDRVPLRGLTRAAVAHYLQHATPGRLAARTVDAVYERTEGNPLFLTEVVRLLVAIPHRDEDHPLQVPDEVRNTLRRRIQHLSPPTRALLSMAAVVGREFDLGLLLRLMPAGDAGVPEGTVDKSEERASRASARAVVDPFQKDFSAHPEVLEGCLPRNSTVPEGTGVLQLLDEAVAAGVVIPVAPRAARYSFSHVLLRDTLYEDLSSDRRVTLHRLVGQALESLHVADVAAHAIPIAHHLLLAAADGNIDGALIAARRAGDRALTCLAYEEAAALYSRALEVLALRRGGPHTGDDRIRCELLLALGDALWGAADLGRVREVFRHAADTAGMLSESERAPLLARAAIGLGGRQQRAHLMYDAEVVSLIERALAALGTADSGLRARLLARLAYALYLQPASYERRTHLCAEAVAMARRSGEATTLRWVLNDCRWALWGPQSTATRVTIAGELRTLATEAGDREMALNEHAWRVVDLLELGDAAAADAELATYTRLARELERPWYHWYVGRFAAMRALLEGRFGDAEQLAEAAHTAAELVQHQDATLVFGTLLLSMRMEQGRAADLEPTVQAFAVQYPTVPVWRAVLAYLHAELEQTAAARADFERVAADDFAALPRDYMLLPSLAYLTEACVVLGDHARAAWLYDQLLPYAERCIVVGFGIVCLGAVARYLGLLATMLGRWEAAGAHFEAALAINAQLHARPALARTAYAYAQMLSEPDAPAAPPARAGELLAQASGAAAELGMANLERQCRQLRDRLGQPEHAELPTHTPAAPLTATFCRQADYWVVAFGDVSVQLKHLAGFSYIAQLLRHPEQEFHIFDLIDGVTDPATERPAPRTDAGEVLDGRARAAYRGRLRELRDDLAAAASLNDAGRLATAQAEFDTLTHELARGVGLDGRARKAASAAERARVNIAKRISSACKRIAQHHPALGSHLARAIRTGTFCSYRPDPLQPIRWAL